MNIQFNQIRVVKKRKDLYKILFSHIRELNNGCELSLMIFFIKRINGSYVKVRKVRVSLYILFFNRSCEH